MQGPLEMAFSEANEWCMNNPSGSILPRIVEDRDNIFQFIKSQFLSKELHIGQTVLVNGIQHSLGKWLWINGHDIEGESN